MVTSGVLWNTLVNRSSRLGPGGVPVDELVVVGEFDTVSKTSQVSTDVQFLVLMFTHEMYCE